MTGKLPKVQEFDVPQDFGALQTFLKQINAEKGPALITSNGRRSMPLRKFLAVLQDERFLGEYAERSDELSQAKEIISAFNDDGSNDDVPTPLADMAIHIKSYCKEWVGLKSRAKKELSMLEDARKTLDSVVNALDVIQGYMSQVSEEFKDKIIKLRGLKQGTAEYTKQEQGIQTQILKDAQEAIVRHLIKRDGEVTQDGMELVARAAGSIPTVLSLCVKTFTAYKEYDELATNAKSLLNAIKHRLPKRTRPGHSHEPD